MCQHSSTTKEEIAALNHQIVNAYLESDWDTAAALLSESHVHNNPFGKALSKEEFLQDLRSGVLKFNTYEIDSMDIQDYGDISVATGLAHVEAMRSDKTVAGDFRFTRIFVKEGDAWRVALFHVTKAQALPTS
tara:strand:- start:48375 stop:48773 length:399 start_codon:yes stop_codon:yes gene_type:complete